MTSWAFWRWPWAALNVLTPWMALVLPGSAVTSAMTLLALDFFSSSEEDITTAVRPATRAMTATPDAAKMIAERRLAALRSRSRWRATRSRVAAILADRSALLCFFEVLGDCCPMAPPYSGIRQWTVRRCAARITYD